MSSYGVHNERMRQLTAKLWTLESGQATSPLSCKMHLRPAMGRLRAPSLAKCDKSPYSHLHRDHTSNASIGTCGLPADRRPGRARSEYTHVANLGMWLPMGVLGKQRLIESAYYRHLHRPGKCHSVPNTTRTYVQFNRRLKNGRKLRAKANFRITTASSFRLLKILNLTRSS